MTQRSQAFNSEALYSNHKSDGLASLLKKFTQLIKVALPG
jgi:hypothetical protein